MSSTAPINALTATANTSFDNTPKKETEPSLDLIASPHGQIRYILERGQAFGLFTKSVTVEPFVPLSNVRNANGSGFHTEPHQYHCVEIAMNMPEGSKTARRMLPTRLIYKDIDSDLYIMSDRRCADMQIFSKPMTEIEMADRLLKWSRNFATYHPSKQMPYLNTITLTRPMPGRSMQDVLNGVGAWIRRAFE